MTGKSISFFVFVLTATLNSTVLSADEHSLAKFGYSDSVDDVRKCLRGFVVDEATLNMIKAHIAQLGDADFVVREDATKALINVPVLPQRLMDEATKSDDAEVRIRARTILKQRAKQPAEKMLEAALRVVADKKLAGLADDVAAALSVAGTSELRKVAASALVATSRESDAVKITELLRGDSVTLRYAGTVALAHVAGADAVEPLRPLLQDDDAHVKFVAATALCNLGDRSALGTFVELLENENYLLRTQAAQVLRSVSGQKFDFDPSAEGEAAAKQIDVWKGWLRDHSQTERLNLPIEAPEEIDLLARGLGGWVGIMNGRPVDDLSRVCRIENGVLKFPTGVYGYLRTRTPHQNYRLSLEYRWPEAAFNDAGVLLMLHGEDSRDGTALEVQIHQGNAGDLYTLGRFDGEFETGVGSRKADSSDKAQGEWNRMDVEVKGGKATIEINDVLQNDGTGGPDKPTHIGLRIERYPIEFRNLMLLPLD